MWARLVVLATAVVMPAGSETILAQVDGTHLRLKFPAGHTRYLMIQAIEGARGRLADPECQQVFTDFQDRSGNSLLANLIATGKSPADYLRDVWFIDASDAAPCRRGLALVAYTSPGHRVVYFCGSRLVHPLYRLEPKFAEFLIIHELLHSLGLGENPPTADQITRQVVQRCGR
jgi:hypothetical protein